METVFRVPSLQRLRMPKGNRRRRRRRSRCESRQRSSSSQSSVEITATAKSPHGGPTIIATATAPVNSRCDRESAAVAMATILAKELQPEHKLPSKEITVWPKPKFLELLTTVGAKGHLFTTRQLLSYLIKYIGSRQLYDEQDPRKVYCQNDPLGKVFGVERFTIKDVKNLLFDNVVIVNDPANIAEHHEQGYQHQQRQSYYTLQHHHEPATTQKDAALRKPSTCTVTTATPATTTSTSMLAPVPPSPVTMEAAVSTSACRSSGVSPDTKVPSHSGNSYVSPLRKTDCSSKEKEQLSSTESTATVESKVSTKSTDVHSSLHGHETAYVADSSDDLWFLEEDGHFSVEYEVESEVSEGYGFGNTSAETDGSDTSTEVYEVLQLCDDDDSCFADDDSSDTDGELTDQDKWTCTECSTWNSPLQRYCVRCWTLRKGWLPDEEKLAQLKSIRGKHHLQRSISAPDAVLHRISSTTTSSAYGGPRSGHIHGPRPTIAGEPISGLTTSMGSVVVAGIDEPDIGISSEQRNLSQTGSPEKLSRGKGRDFPDSSSSGPDGADTCSVDESVGEREVRLAEDDAGIWPAQGQQDAPGNLPVGGAVVRDVPGAESGDASGVSEKDTGPAGSSGVFPGSPRSAKRSMPEPDSPERLPLKKRKTSRDGSSPDKDFPGIRGSSPHGLKLDLDLPTPGDSELGKGRQAGGNLGGNSGTPKHPSPVTLRPESSGSTMSPQSQDDHHSSHHASGCVDELSPLMRMRRAGQEDSGVHMPAFQSETSTSSGGVPVERPQPELSSSPTKSYPAPASAPSTSRSIPTPQPGPSTTRPTSRDPRVFSDQCMICLTRPKTGSIIHGRTGHQVCCYSCAKKLRRHGKPCPVCRRPIQFVIKNFLI